MMKTRVMDWQQLSPLANGAKRRVETNGFRLERLNQSKVIISSFSSKERRSNRIY